MATAMSWLIASSAVLLVLAVVVGMAQTDTQSDELEKRGADDEEILHVATLREMLKADERARDAQDLLSDDDDDSSDEDELVEASLVRRLLDSDEDDIESTIQAKRAKIGVSKRGFWRRAIRKVGRFVRKAYDFCKKNKVLCASLIARG